MVTILANTITANMGLIPGFGIIGPLFGLPLSIMAAIIERPFLTAAGVERHAVWYSIRANVLSLLAGYVLVFVGLILIHDEDALLIFWPFAAVLISTALERSYLSARAPLRRQLPFTTVLAANVVSALVCVLLLVPVTMLDQAEIKDALRPWQLPLSIVLATVCAAAVVMSYVIPRKARVEAS